ncbi:MAG: methionine biosynthesis protein MetW [Elusimicrobiota bacterium]
MEIIVIIFLILLLLLIAVVMMLFFWSTLTTRAPFIPAPREILPAIVQALELKEGSTVYDLGCGDGRVLEACWRKQPQIKYAGLEKDWLPFWLAKWRLRQNKDIKIIRQNFLKRDLSDATHIFLYLFPEVMDQLLLKFEKELRPGTRVISCSFRFSRKEPISRIDLHRSKELLGRDLHVYEF